LYLKIDKKINNQMLIFFANGGFVSFCNRSPEIDKSPFSGVKIKNVSRQGGVFSFPKAKILWGFLRGLSYKKDPLSVL